MPDSSTPAVLALVGPTGAGKTGLALAAAERLAAAGRRVEIVAVDAFTLYRGMDVGTAKPTLEQQARVPHHLVDLLAPSETSTIARFQTEARAAIKGIHGRGATALLVGGSGLYFRAAVDPLELPPTDPEVRAEVEARHGGDARAAHAALAVVDPEAAARIDPENVRRSIRALEVHALTGRPFSDWRCAWDGYTSVYPDLRVVGVDLDRATLDERITARVEVMLASGLVEECRRLQAQPLSDTARQAIGYAEVFDHLAGRCSLAEAAERTRVRTRRYAARQQRWFRADPRIRWTPPEHVVDALVDPGRTRPT